MKDKDSQKIVSLTIKITLEAKKQIKKLAKKNRRSMSKEIERLIMEAE